MADGRTTVTIKNKDNSTITLRLEELSAETIESLLKDVNRLVKRLDDAITKVHLVLGDR